MTASTTRILLVAPRVWDGGMEMHLSNLALLYSEHGYRVTLAVDPRFPAHAGRAGKLAASGAEFVKVPGYDSDPLPVRLFKRRADFSRALAPRSFDMVLCQGFGYSLPWFRRFVAPGGRFLWHEHTDGACARILQPGFHAPTPSRYPRLFRRMFRHLDGALAGSARGVANLRRVQGLTCPVHAIAPLMEAFDIPDASERKTGARPLRIGVFGTIHPNKGSEAILRLWPSLAIGPATLHFHGRLAAAPLDALARALGVPAVFHGPYRSEELPALMQATDMALIPSLMEGYPLTAWECMARGVPFVITDVGAAPEFARDNPNIRLAALAPEAVRRRIEEHVAALRAGDLSRAALQQHQRRHFAREDAARAYLSLLS
ncbi:MAG TPA: glycosyltransferase family 4 protein [Bryobacteraceae bacterium]|nr:glycosyltransferase family 4 protein [Bryobacteraceae bacterium]